MYIGHSRLCVCVSVCLSVPRRISTLLHGPGCNLGHGRGCPLVVHYWADLQSVHGFRCYDNIHENTYVSLYPYALQMRVAPIAKCQRVLVLALWLVIIINAKIIAILSRENASGALLSAVDRRRHGDRRAVDLPYIINMETCTAPLFSTKDKRQAYYCRRWRG